MRNWSGKEKENHTLAREEEGGLIFLGDRMRLLSCVPHPVVSEYDIC